MWLENRLRNVVVGGLRVTINLSRFQRDKEVKVQSSENVRWISKGKDNLGGWRNGKSFANVVNGDGRRRDETHSQKFTNKMLA